MDLVQRIPCIIQNVSPCIIQNVDELFLTLYHPYQGATEFQASLQLSMYSVRKCRSDVHNWSVKNNINDKNNAEVQTVSAIDMPKGQNTLWATGDSNDLASHIFWYNNIA